MKTMKLSGIRQMKMMEVPDPKIVRDSDVLIKMKSLGICGSDIHYYATGRIGSQVVQYPFTVGHEGAGEVVEVGKAVKSVQPGDRIAIEPAMPCWECDQCRAGRPHTCRKLKFLGCPGQAEGCLSEYIVMPETSCFKIADNLTYDQAVILEPLAIGVYAVRQSIDLKGSDVGILGFGPIGMSVLLPVLAKGASKVIVSDKIDARLDIADKSGASYMINPDREDVSERTRDEVPGLLDVVFECCGQQDAVDTALNILKPGGKLVLIGIPEFDRWQFDADLFRRKEICLQNIRRQNHALEEAHSMVSEGKINIDAMPTHHFSFRESKEAFDLVADYRDGVMKAMIHF